APDIRRKTLACRRRFIQNLILHVTENVCGRKLNPALWRIVRALPRLREGAGGVYARVENFFFIRRRFSAVDGSADAVDDGVGIVERLRPIAGSCHGVPVDVLRCAGGGGACQAAGEDDWGVPVSAGEGGERLAQEAGSAGEDAFSLAHQEILSCIVQEVGGS